ncbi:VENN motif pre-toxin domain-containing protein, partial [Providencia rettgeri]|nr:VENN motif pre-toxin domain-containing protein [Providencia rettgeri]
GAQSLGAMTGEAMGMLSVELYGKTVGELTEDEKATVSAFASLAAGIAGGLVGGDTSSAGNAAEAGKTTVENNSLSGDQLRESYKESAKWWKDQTRETFGEGTTSTAINSVIGALEDAGDLAIAGGDYVLDGAAAVTACATASNYCQKALNDLEGKHQGALDVATSLINGDSWNAIQDLAKRAGEGDQLAAEQLGAAMAGIFIPGKKVPTPVVTTGKLLKNADGFLEIKVNTTPLEGHGRLNTVDSLGNGKFNPAEAAAAARLETSLGQMDRLPEGIAGKASADFIITSGANKGKTVDLMYTTKNLKQAEIDGINKFYEKNMTVSREAGKLPPGQDQIIKHLNKADIVPVDFSVLTPKNQQIFMDYVKTLPKSQRDKIIILR